MKPYIYRSKERYRRFKQGMKRALKAYDELGYVYYWLGVCRISDQAIDLQSEYMGTRLNTFGDDINETE